MQMVARASKGQTMKFTTTLLRAMIAVGYAKKDSKAPPPDPSVGAAQKQLADLAVRQQDWYEGNIAPALLDQMKQNTAISGQVADANMKTQAFQTGLAKKYDDRYWGTQVPLEDQMIKQAQAYNEPGEQEKMAGAAGADVEQAANVSNADLQRGLRLRGINLGSGAAIGAMADNAQNTTLAKAGAMNKTREIARQMGWQRLGEATSLGKGLPSFGAGSTQLALGAGQGAVGAAGSGLAGVGTASGVANNNSSTLAANYGASGNMGLGLSQISAQNWQTQQNNDPLQSMLGAAAGAAAT
jgi:hypothetical protein